MVNWREKLTGKERESLVFCKNWIASGGIKPEDGTVPHLVERLESLLDEFDAMAREITLETIIEVLESLR
jgi:hypothetical protein